MSVLLYPPILQGVIPAQYGNTLIIPYTMNKAVSFDENEISGFYVKILSIQNEIKIIENKISIDDCTATEITFNNDDNLNLQIGNFYKIQICYYKNSESENDNDITSPYSTVAIFKYTGEPKIKIKNLSSDQNINNNHIFNYIGSYIPNEEDPSEKLYSSIFRIYDNFNNVYLESEELLHNCLLDSELEETETYSFSADLPEDKVYKIQFQATTINGLIVNSPYYKIVQPKKLEAPEGYELEAELDYENGAVNLNLIVSKSIDNKIAFLRSSEDSDYLDWIELFQQVIRIENETEERIKKNIWKDFTVEHGKNYKYAICLINSSDGYSTRLEINKEIFIDFEDIFLFDGEKMLKVRFNQNISSFKENILETKIDTIGNKYPYFFRNGDVRYKEFPVTGVISFLEDENGYFSKELYNKRKELYKKSDNTLEYKLNPETFKEELDFKMEVLNWLNNGQPKLLKSCSEGNFLVRLMNVSLSPLSNGINRLIHSFSCTAYEIGDKTDKILKEKNFFNPIILEEQEMEYITKNFITDFIDGYFPIYDVTFNVKQTCQIYINDQKIYIYPGYNLGKDYKIEKLSIIDGQDYGDGTITFGYYPKTSKFFNNISTISTRIIPMRQIAGKGNEINILNLLSDKKTQLNKILSLSLKVRPIIEMKTTADGILHYYFNNEELLNHSVNEIFIYTIGSKYYEYKIKLTETGKITKTYIELTEEDIKDNSYSIKISSDDSTSTNGNISFSISISNLNLNDIRLGKRIYAEIAYSTNVKNYTAEIEDSDIKELSDKYSKALSDLNIGGITEIEALKVQETYNELIQKLIEKGVIPDDE